MMPPILRRKSAAKTRKTHRPKPVKLLLEVLEDRTVPSILFDKPLDMSTPGFGHGAQSRPGAQKIAEDFVLSASGAADAITFYGTFFGGRGNTGTFDIMFFNDSAGAPNGNPFYVLNTGTIAGAAVGVDLGQPIFSWNVPLQHVVFPNLGRYWVSVSGSPDWAWENSSPGIAKTKYIRYYYTDPWTLANVAPGQETLAFQLLTNAPDIVPTQLAWNPTQGGVDFSYGSPQ